MRLTSTYAGLFTSDSIGTVALLPGIRNYAHGIVGLRLSG